ncbi:hypothetical protein GCM10027051_30850 [Niabella terrae]
MKRLLWIGLCLMAVQAQAQDSIVINFKTKSVTVPRINKKTRNIWLKVTDLPTDQYKITINKTDSFFRAGNSPSLFSVLSFGEGFNSILAGLTAYSVNSLTPSIPSSLLTGGDRDLIDKFLPNRPADQCKGANADLVKNLILAMRSEVFHFHYRFRDQVITPADQLIYRVETGTEKDSKSFQSAAEKILEKRLQMDQELEQIYVNYYDSLLQPAMYSTAKSCPAFQVGDSMLTVYKKQFNLFLNRFDTSFNRTLIAKLYNKLKAKPTQEFVSLPYKLHGDLTSFEVGINPVNPEKNFQAYNTTIELEKRPDQLLSFTSGVFISGLTHDAFAIKANLAASTTTPGKMDTLNYSIISENSNRVSAGINALLHYGGYFRTQNELGYFIAFGPGLTLEKNPQLRISLGTGLMLGRNNKLALSFGVMAGSVARLSKAYQLDEPYYSAPTAITRDRFATSWFLSLGYALFDQ